MSQQATYTVFDGASTPVSHSLLGIGVKSDLLLGEQAYWRENLGALPEQAQVRLCFLKKVLKSGFTRTEVRVETPVMEAVSGVNAFGYTASPKVAHVPAVSIVQYKSPRATYNEMVLLNQILRNIYNNVATTVPAVTAGAAAEVLHSGIMPS